MKTEKEKLEFYLTKINLNKISEKDLKECFDKAKHEQKKINLQKQIDKLTKELNSLE